MLRNLSKAIVFSSLFYNIQAIQTHTSNQDLVNNISSSLQDSWILEFEDIINAQESNVFEGLRLQHRVSKNKTNEQLRVSLYRDNCADPYDGGAVILMDKGIELDESSELDKAVFSLQFDQLLMSSSPLWQESADSDKGIMSFCVKTELLYLENEAYLSVSFTDISLKLALDLSIPFQLERTHVKEKEEFVAYHKYDSSISACLCRKTVSEGSSYECNNEAVLHQNSHFHICVFTSNDIEVTQFDQIVLYQDGEAKYIPVRNGESDKLTHFSSNSGVAVVRGSITSTFFRSRHPLPITFEGSVSLRFKLKRFLLEDAEDLHQQNEDHASFELKITLEEIEPFNAKVIVIAAFITFSFAVFLFMLWRTKLRNFNIFSTNFIRFCRVLKSFY